jgi:hypothetical protein
MICDTLTRTNLCNFLFPSPLSYPTLLVDDNFIKMPSKASKKPHWAYTEDSLINAILDIKNHQISIRQAAQKWGVPRSTLSNRLKGQIASADQIQPNQLLTKNQEAKLASWILR